MSDSKIKYKWTVFGVVKEVPITITLMFDEQVNKSVAINKTKSMYAPNKIKKIQAY